MLNATVHTMLKKQKARGKKILKQSIQLLLIAYTEQIIWET
jgi:hypothetical protein